MAALQQTSGLTPLQKAQDASLKVSTSNANFCKVRAITACLRSADTLLLSHAEPGTSREPFKQLQDNASNQQQVGMR